MKKKIIIVGLSLILFSTTGCVERLSLSDEDESKIVEYSVYSVLEHDKNYLLKLNPERTEYTVEEGTTSETGIDENTTESVKQPAESGIVPDSGNDNNESYISSINEVLGIAGADISCKGMEVCDNYPNGDSMAFVLKAGEGKKLIVLHIDVTNTTSTELSLDIPSRKVKFKGIFNNKSINAMTTLLPQAFNTYSGTLASGATANLVLVFETDRDNEIINSAKLVITTDASAGTLNLQ